MAPAREDLLDRDAELETLQRTLTATATGAGSLVVVTGPAGIGKSRLLAEGRSLGRAQGFTVVSARSGELERGYPFGVVRQLFEALVQTGGAQAHLLEGPAAAAKTVFAGIVADGAVLGKGADISFSVLHGLYWLTVNLASDHPVLVVVDDLQWCDPASLRFLAYLVPRLDGLAASLLVGLRSGSAATGTDDPLLSAITGDGATTAIRPGPLGQDAVARLAVAALDAEPDEAFAAACHHATGGNPLLVGELLRSLGAASVPPDAAHIDDIATVGPRTMSRAVLSRLARLSPDAVEVARSVAILGDGADLKTVATITGQDETSFAAAVDSLVRAELLNSRPLLGFVHPVVREAVYRDLTPRQRGLRHNHAANALHGAGAPAARVATQLLAVQPTAQAWVVEMLQQAARSALATGAPDNAVAYLRRAMREPPTPRQRAGVLFDLGTAEALVDAGSATVHLAAARVELTDPSARIAAAELLVRLALFTRPAVEAAEIARETRAELPTESVDQRHMMDALQRYAKHFGAPPTSSDTSAALSDSLENTGPGSRALIAVTAWDRALDGGSAAETLELARAALAGGSLIRADPAVMSLVATSALILADADEAVAVCERILDETRRNGSLFAISGAHQCQGWNWLARGDLAEAEDCLRRTVSEVNVLHGSTWNAGTPYAAAFLAWALLERGDLAGAREAIDSAGVPASGADSEALWRRIQIEVLLAEDRNRQAVDAADSFAAHSNRIVNPAWAPWRSQKARALMRLGEQGEAIELFEAELDLARAWNAPGTLGPALRRLGVARAGRDGLELLGEAVRTTAGSPVRLEHAKSLTALGAALRHGGHTRDARSPLRDALDIATDCGATPLCELVAAELAAAGGRPHARRGTGPAALTPSERRVAELAAEGNSNRAIAQTLYVSPKTVEVHLSNTYRKLGIHARGDLVGALDEAD